MQLKMTEYLYKKNGSVMVGGTKPPPSILRARDPGSREHSDVSTEKIEDEVWEDKPAAQNKPYCPLLRLILPKHEINYRALLKKLEGLHAQCTKKNVIAFIRTQIKERIGKANTSSIDVKNLEDLASSRFWEIAVPTMLTRAIRGFAKPIPLLLTGNNHTVALTKGQVFDILTHMFLCTLPAQYAREDTTLCYLFCRGLSQSTRSEKLKCLVAYYEAMADCSEVDLAANIIYQRICSRDRSYTKTVKPMSEIDFTRKYIEQHKQDLMVDFANKQLGGGVLKNGCVQEEILFVTHPELLVTTVLFDVLEDNECAVVHGCTQYANYTGYSSTFKFNGKHPERFELDGFDKAPRTFVLIDAIDYARGIYKTNQNAQVTESMFMRELHKAYLGFSANQYMDESSRRKKIATGRWGCGAFQGDVELKMVLQWLACSFADRAMVFVNWNEEERSRDAVALQQIVGALKGRTTQEVITMLKCYGAFRKENKIEIPLVDYICDIYFM